MSAPGGKREDSFYLAPMEGVTGYVYRNACHACFHPMDKYFTPFISPKSGQSMNTRERNDILPENNRGLNVVPQILSNNPESFIKAALELSEYGYREVDLNLGCPSRTVAAKGKGAGFLAHSQELDAFFDRVFEGLSGRGVKISVKTRLGMERGEEFEGLLAIYCRYPFEELIIHPRVQADYYKNTPDLDWFGRGLSRFPGPVCYNGDIFSKADFDRVSGRFPELSRFMLGRGVIADPGLTGRLAGGPGADKGTLERFHGLVYEGYRELMPGEQPVLFKMKELWFYLIQSFEGGEKAAKAVRKAKRLSDYEAAVRFIFRELSLKEDAGGCTDV